MPGGNIGRLSARRFNAAFNPSNYTPSSVGDESTNKISAHLKGIDNALASATVGGSDGQVQYNNGGALRLIYSSSCRFTKLGGT